MKMIIKSISPKMRIKASKTILISWGIYMTIIVPINHFLFPAWFHGDMGINFGDEFDLWAVWLIGAYSIGLGVGCFVAATDPMRYYATVLEIFIGTFFMAVVCIASVPILGTDPYQWTTYFTGILLILFCFTIFLIYPLTPPKNSRKNDISY